MPRVNRRTRATRGEAAFARSPIVHARSRGRSLALDSPFPRRAFPFARRTTAARSAARLVTRACPAGQRAGRARPPDTTSGPGPSPCVHNMNQITFKWAERSDERDFTLAESEQPQQRLETFGVRAVSDTELLAILIQGNGTRPTRAVTMATRLIAEAGSMAGFLSWEAVDYRRMKGIGPIKGLQLAALAEIARRMMTASRTEAPLLNRPELIAQHFQPIVAGLAVEKFWVCLLNRKNRLIKTVEITSGTATQTLAHPREVFREALMGRTPVSALCVVHNHPSGSPEPSAADCQVTRVLRDGARTLDLDLLDHVIVGDPAADPSGRGYHSFRESGVL